MLRKKNAKRKERQKQPKVNYIKEKIMATFKEDVEFYLNKKNRGFNYYGFDVANDSIAEDDEGGDEGGDDASVKTGKGKKKVCPECGKEKCECDASMRTNTHGEEDDDGWHASSTTFTPEQVKLLKLIAKNNGLGKGFKPENDIEKEMLELASKMAETKASVDDKGAGYAPSVKTKDDECGKKKNLKEEILSNV